MKTMLNTEFQFRMKVKLKGRLGVVIRPEGNSDWDLELGLIKWDSDKEDYIEDWRGLFGTFTNSGGEVLLSKV